MHRHTFTIYIPAFIERLFVAFLLLYRRTRYGYPFRRIPLGNSDIFAIVDPDDYDYLIQFKRRYKPAPYSAYAARTVYYNRTKQNEYMHRVIMESALKEYSKMHGIPASQLNGRP